MRGAITMHTRAPATASGRATAGAAPVCRGALAIAPRHSCCAARPRRAAAARAGNAPPPAGGAPWESGEPTRVTREEAAGLSVEQLAFLERKRRGIMPQGSVCGSCKGCGSVVCPKCGGSGVNAYQADEELFQGAVRQQNGVLDVEVLFRKDWPCWLCRGREEIGCPDCLGAGFKGIAEMYTGD